MIYASPGASFLARVEGFPSGLAGTVGVQILSSTGSVTTARTTAGIAESPAGSGSYIVTLTAPSTIGQYSVFWDTGTISPSTTASEDLTVTSSGVVTSSSPNYVSLSTLKSTLQLSGQTFADSDLQAAINAASRAIDQQTGRRFYPDADANQIRKFWPLNPGFALIDDLCTFTQLSYQGDIWTLDTDFYLEPINAAADGRPWTGIRTIARPFIYTLAERASGWAGFDGRIQVTGMWGWASTPPEIIEATTILASRLLRRSREAPFAVVGTGIDGEAVRLGKLDPDVAMLISPYTLSVIA